MIRIIVLFTFTVLGCRSDGATTPQPVKCGVMPNAVLSCLGNPTIVKPDVAKQCQGPGWNCDKTKCIFEKSGWMNGDQIDQSKLVAYFDQFAKDHPAWTPAVQHVTTSCVRSDLPAQGAFVNCTVYDVMFCALAGFIKHAQPFQWSRSSSCEYPRRYAASCPVCPSDCFAPQVPYGSCNACLLLPTSP